MTLGLLPVRSRIPHGSTQDHAIRAGVLHPLSYSDDSFWLWIKRWPYEGYSFLYYAVSYSCAGLLTSSFAISAS